MTSWSKERLDIVGIGGGGIMYHTSWDGTWQKDPTFDSLAGVFISAPAIASSSSDRLEVFGTGEDFSMYYKFWDGSNWMSKWVRLEGKFISDPAAVS